MNKEHQKLFEAALEDLRIVGARTAVLNVTVSTLPTTADVVHVFGFLYKDQSLLAVALVLRILKELCGGMAALLSQENVYGAAALLRQVIEVEYLLFREVIEPGTLGRWYTLSSDDRRKMFTPARMRKDSAGRFSDSEYWSHCDLGGHPHPNARALLQGYEQPFKLKAYLFPDAIHHISRACESVDSIFRRSQFAEQLVPLTAPILASLGLWRADEDPIILSYHGLKAIKELDDDKSHGSYVN
jgi:hypothetical protein